MIYYLPFYFQAVKGKNARDSGIQNLPFLITLLFAPMVSGVIINFVGAYLPFMWFGAATATVGCGLLFSVRNNASQSQVAAYQFLAGLGLGSCNQLPYSVTQYKLPKDLLVMGSTMVSFCNSLGPVLGTNVAQAIFTSSLKHDLENLGQLDPIAVIRGGPTNVASVVRPSLQLMVRETYGKALSNAFIPAIISAGLAFCCSLTIQWGNLHRQPK